VYCGRVAIARLLISGHLLPLGKCMPHAFGVATTPKRAASRVDNSFDSYQVLIKTPETVRKRKRVIQMTLQKNNQWNIGNTMLFSEWIRRAGFWTLDFIRGSKVRKHYVDVKNIMEMGMDPNISKIQGDQLNSILKYATENVEFYKKFNGSDSIKSFPVVNKNIIRNNYEAFWSPEFLEAAVVNMQTSGSTGAPFVVRHDKNKRKRVYAEMMYFWGKAGYQIGMKYAFFRISNPFSVLTAWARNVLVFDDRNQGEEIFEKFRKTLKSDRKIKMLLGLPSTLEDFGNYLLTCGDTLEKHEIKTIICYGEALPKTAHQKLKKIFNANIVSLYSNQEMGMLAQECVENKEFHVNGASYHIELLKMDSDDPVSIGEPGRIVVTDLFNHAMPLIRYDTGDIGAWKKEAECGWHSQVFSSIQGQMIDIIFDTMGNKKSPHAISVLMGPFDKLLQYQFVQEDAKQYVLKLNGAEGHYDDAEFVNLFKDFLGKDAEIVIEHVNEIPVLGSGKRKEVVNNYIKGKE
jgi:phenylacetate-CoA ligase